MILLTQVTKPLKYPTLLKRKVKILNTNVIKICLIVNNEKNVILYKNNEKINIFIYIDHVYLFLLKQN